MSESIKHPWETTLNFHVSRIVDRCSVGADYLTVLRYVLSRIEGGRAAFLKQRPEVRRIIIRTAFQTHRSNRDLYRAVVNGTVGWGG